VPRRPHRRCGSLALTLALLFLATALAYATVGFGGGSTYNALLVLADVDYRVLPTIALACNLIVVTGGVIRYARAGHLDWRFAWPFVALSAPMAWLGGRLPVSRETFMLLLGLALVVSGVAMILEPRGGADPSAPPRPRNVAFGVATGGAIGFLGGLVGIGGGIILAPFLYRLRLAPPRLIAATASLYILVNSAAGLTGQAAKLGGLAHWQVLREFAPLFLAVLVGGQVGSWLGSGRIPARAITWLTALLVLYVGLRLLASWLGA
jgi:uncharacterized membrane protein YfcA